MEVVVISETQQSFNGELYYKCGEYFQHDGKRLHREVWEHHFGKIPEGAVVHHINGDKTDNRVSNLALIASEGEHTSLHFRQNPRFSMPKECIEASKDWHKSPEGRAWHKQHYERDCAGKMHGTFTCTCLVCGKTFESGRSDAKFCCNYHSQLHRKRSGVDDEQRKCVICGSSFTCNKYLRLKTCSRDCKRNLISQSHTGLKRKK